jgi:hypothetical protein
MQVFKNSPLVSQSGNDSEIGLLEQPRWLNFSTDKQIDQWLSAA